MSAWQSVVETTVSTILSSLPRPNSTVTTEDPSAWSPCDPRSNPRKKEISLKKHREIRAGPRAPAASRYTHATKTRSSASSAPAVSIFSIR